MAAASGLDNIKSITDFELKDKRVFLRLDLNVPTESTPEGVVITDDNRIQGALPTIQFLVKAGAKVVMASHFGRPKSKEDRKKFSLEPVARRLTELLDMEVILIDDPESDAPKGLLPTLRPNQILLLENLRFAEGEEKNEAAFASEMADYTDIYINDAFGASHRAHASIVALPALIKQKGIGFLMKKEIQMLDQLLYKTPSPFIAVLGGSKVSDKIGVIENLMDRIDTFIIGGAMAYTFLAAKNITVGNSRIEQDKVRLAGELIKRIEARDKKIVLPIDHVIAPSMDKGSEAKNTQTDAIPEGFAAFDIGPQTRQLFKAELNKGKTIFWNGPMGVFEKPPFEKGHVFYCANLGRIKGRNHDRGRRRFCRGGEGIGACGKDDAHFDRRWG